LAKSISDVVGGFIEERIESHSRDIELIHSFKDLLSELPAKLQQEGDKPLVIIIDELDRCKPTFVVEMLEKIKHLFSVKNVVFVLVMNKNQLEESIRNIYGQNIDAHTYLQKFIHLEAKLPKRIDDRYANDLRKYINRLIQLHELQTWGDERNIVDYLEAIANHFDLSLRQLEKVFTNLTVFYGASAENRLRIVPIIVFLAVIKVIKPMLFDGLLQQKISCSELIQKLNLQNIDENNQYNSKIDWMMEWMRYSLLTENEFNSLPEDDDIKRFGRGLFNYNVDIEMLIPIFAQQLSMFVVA